METRSLEVSIISARDLQDVNLVSKMDVYAVATLLGDSRTKQTIKTSIDREGGRNPTWNFPIRFTIDSRAAKQNRLVLEIKLRCSRALGDKDIGEVNIPVKELLDSAHGNGQSLQYISYQVRKPSGRPKGELNISYKFGDTVVGPSVAAAPPPKTEPYAAHPSAPFAAPPAKPAAATHPFDPFAAAQAQPSKAEPGVPYPAQGIGCSSSAPSAPPYHAPPPAGYPYQATSVGYAYAPATQGYGAYPPPPPGYGYPPPPAYGYPQVQRPQQNNNLGLGLGAGLLGGALAGFVIGDLVSDIGFGDGGFGF